MNLDKFKELYSYEIENKAIVSVESCDLIDLIEYLESRELLPKKEWSNLEYCLDHAYENGQLDTSDIYDALEELHKAQGYNE